MLKEIKSFDEFIGQKTNKENLNIYINASKIKKQKLDHIFIYAPSGMGKSTLAKIIANQMNTKITIYYANNIRKPSDLFSCLSKIKENEILFIDEIHRLNKELEEYLFPVLENNNLSITIGKDHSAKIVQINLSKFTIICATTELHKISDQFLNRFPIFIPFCSYKFSDIKLISKNLFEKLNLKITENALDFFVKNTKFNPRNVNNIIKRIYDFCLVSNLDLINIEYLKNIFLKLNIFVDGITEIDYQYLKILKTGPHSIKTIKQLTNFPLQMILDKIEPHLLQNSYIIKTNKGRKLTEKGIDFLLKIQKRM